MDRDEVPEAKSSLSTSPTRSPRVTASSVAPEPVAPPPMTRTSSGFDFPAASSAESCAFLAGTTAGTASVIAGGDERLVQDEGATVRGGNGRGDGAEFSEARHLCGAMMKSAVGKRWLRLLLI